MKNTIRIFQIACTLAVFGNICSQQAVAEVVDVTDKKGRTITAELVNYDGTNVTISRKSDRRKFSIPVADLDDKTQNAIKEWLADGGNLVKEYEVDVKTGKSTEREGSFSSYRILRLNPSFSVKNPDIVKDSKPAYITILFLGRPTDSRTQIHVFKKQTFKIPKLEPLKSTSFQVDAIANSYSDEYDSGERYLGYIWVIHNKTKTEVYGSKSVPSSYAEKYARNFLELKEDVTYMDNFKPAPSPY
ncbi:MAG: hypothetical protein AB8D78_01395 [Akkermansiaceae bacterium]